MNHDDYNRDRAAIRRAELASFIVSLIVLAGMVALFWAVIAVPAKGDSRGRMRRIPNGGTVVIWIPTPQGIPVPLVRPFP